MTTTDRLDDAPLGQILAEIEREHASSRMSDEMLAAMDNFRADYPSALNDLVAQVMAVTLVWVTQALEREPDEVVVEQSMLAAAHLAVATVARGLKARRGAPLVPGRFALAAWHFATTANAIPDFKPADLAKADDLLTALRTPIERERDALRTLIDDIADMDLGDVEIEHSEIIALCRTAQRHWHDAETEATP